MSLTERIQMHTSGASLEGGRVCPPGLDDLRAALQEHISSDEIAAVMADNPLRAKNEIRSVCNRVFAEGAWRSRPPADKDRLVDELIDSVFGLGPLEGMLKDSGITEIMVNGSASILYERDGKLYRSQSGFSDDGQVRALIDRIIGPLGRRIDEASPMVNARLVQGHRVHAVIPPLSLDGPILTIRKFKEHVFTLEEMRDLGSFDGAMLTFLKWVVLARKNVAVSGGTGSGKTTLLNALSCVIPEGERIITVEDSAELRFLTHPHVVRLEARCRNAEGTGEVSIRELVINALRMRPDRIIVGECRGGEAIDMLQAMNTGHDGSLTTLHANSSADVVTRLSTMVRYAADLPVDVIDAQIASAVDYVVQTARGADGRRVIEEVASFEYRRETARCATVPLFAWDYAAGQGRWADPPGVLDELVAKRIASQEEVAAWKLSAGLR